MTILQNEDIFKIGNGIIKTHDLLPLSAYVYILKCTDFGKIFG